MPVILGCALALPFVLFPSLGTLQNWELAALDGTVWTPRSLQGKKAVAFVFLGTECPVSNSFVPELNRLAESAAAADCLLIGVHSDPNVSLDEAKAHAREYRLRFPILLDPQQSLAKQAGATIMPEAVVIDPRGTIRYRGRVNDKYTPQGKRRLDPSSHDLADALRAVAMGKEPNPKTTKAFGCPLPR